MSLIKKPISDRVVLVDVDLLFSKSQTGLILSEHGAMAIQKGRVHSAGKDCEQVKEEDWVMFEKGRGVDIRFMGQKYLIIREMDIMTILNESEIKKDE